MAVVLEPVRATSLVRRPSRADAALRSWLSTEVLVFLAVWLLLMIAGRQRLFQDPGTFWHTAVGEQMLSTGRLVREDSFTFTFRGQPWIAHQWLGECLMALAYRVGGWDTLLLGSATLLAGLFTWLAHRWQHSEASPVLVTGLLAAVFIASAHHFHARPHLASLALLAVLFGILCDVENGRAPVRRLAWLVPLFVLWTNLHGGVLGGLATLTLVMIGWLLAPWLRWPSPLSNWTARLGAMTLLAACFGTMFVSPFGVEMPRAWLTIMRLSLPDVIQEHGRPDLTRPEGWMVLLLGIGYVAMLWRAGRWRTTLLVPLVWFLLACDRVRHAPLFAVVVAVAWAELLRRSTREDRSGQHPKPAAPLHRLRHAVVPSLLVAMSLGLQASGVCLPVLGRGWAQHDRSVWPVELLGELRRLEHAPGGSRVFNTLHYGGFLAFHTPGIGTFIDDRCELFGDSFLREYALAERLAPDQIDRWQQQYCFQYALVRTSSPFDRHLTQSAAWHVVKRSPAAALYRYGSP